MSYKLVIVFYCAYSLIKLNMRKLECLGPLARFPFGHNLHVLVVDTLSYIIQHWIDQGNIRSISILGYMFYLNFANKSICTILEEEEMEDNTMDCIHFQQIFGLQVPNGKNQCYDKIIFLFG